MRTALPEYQLPPASTFNTFWRVAAGTQLAAAQSKSSFNPLILFLEIFRFGCKYSRIEKYADHPRILCTLEESAYYLRIFLVYTVLVHTMLGGHHPNMLIKNRDAIQSNAIPIQAEIIWGHTPFKCMQVWSKCLSMGVLEERGEVHARDVEIFFFKEQFGRVS